MLHSRTIPFFLAVIALCVAAAFADEPGTPGQGPQAGPPEGGTPDHGPRRGPDDFFRRHDADQDGRVTLAELIKHAKRFLDDVDADEDGAINADELKAHHDARGAQRPQREGPEGGEGERPQRGGREGGEGQRPEHRPGAGQEQGRGPSGRQRPEPDVMFKRLDTNEDGVLSLDEFKAGARPHRRPARVRPPTEDEN